MFRITKIVELTSKYGSFKDVERDYLYLATDSGGDVWGYNKIPIRGEQCFYPDRGEQCFHPNRGGQCFHPNRGDISILVATVEYEGDWRDSLRRSKR